MELNGDVRKALTSGHLAHLVTLESDGTPQVTVVWVGLEDDEIVAGHLEVWRKVANIRRDPRVVLSMETGGHTPMAWRSTWWSTGGLALRREVHPPCSRSWHTCTSVPTWRFLPWTTHRRAA